MALLVLLAVEGSVTLAPTPCSTEAVLATVPLEQEPVEAADEKTRVSDLVWLTPMLKPEQRTSEPLREHSELEPDCT